MNKKSQTILYSIIIGIFILGLLSLYFVYAEGSDSGAKIVKRTATSETVKNPDNTFTTEIYGEQRFMNDKSGKFPYYQLITDVINLTESEDDLLLQWYGKSLKIKLNVKEKDKEEKSIKDWKLGKSDLNYSKEIKDNGGNYKFGWNLKDKSKLKIDSFSIEIENMTPMNISYNGEYIYLEDDLVVNLKDLILANCTIDKINDKKIKISPNALKGKSFDVAEINLDPTVTIRTDENNKTGGLLREGTDGDHYSFLKFPLNSLPNSLSLVSANLSVNITGGHATPPTAITMYYVKNETWVNSVDYMSLYSEAKTNDTNTSTLWTSKGVVYENISSIFLTAWSDYKSGTIAQNFTIRLDSSPDNTAAPTNYYSTSIHQVGASSGMWRQYDWPGAFGYPSRLIITYNSVDMSIGHPLATTYNYNESLSLNYTITNYTAAIDTCWFSIINSTDGYEIVNTTLPSCLNSTFNISKDGSYTLWLNVNQTDFLNASSSVAFTVYTGTPAINLTYPLNTTYSSRVNTINYSISGKMDYCWYSVDFGATNTSFTCGNNITGITASKGSNTWKIWVNDTNNNINSSSVTFETIAPSLNITYPLNTTYSSNITWMNYSAQNTAESCWYSLNNGTTNTTITCGVNITGITSGEGTNKWTIWVNNTYNDVNSSSVTFIKYTEPVINITYPSTNGIWFNTTGDVNYSITDANTCWWTRNAGATNTTITCGVNITGQVWNVSNTVTVYANSSVGTNVSDSIQFYVDVSNPSVYFTSPTLANGTIINNNWVTINSTILGVRLPALKDTFIDLYNSSGYLWRNSRFCYQDNAGNTTTVITQTYGNITIISPLNITYRSTTTVYINFSLNKPAKECRFTLKRGGSTLPLDNNRNMTKINSTYFNYTRTSLTTDRSYRVELINCSFTDSQNESYWNVTHFSVKGGEIYTQGGIQEVGDNPPPITEEGAIAQGNGTCTMNQTGSYTTSLILQPDYFTDKDWDTASIANIEGYIYINYTKALGALNTSIWLVKDGDSTTYPTSLSGTTYLPANPTTASKLTPLSIPQDCWNYSTGENVSLRAYSQALSGWPYTSSYSWDCYNGTLWRSLRNGSCYNCNYNLSYLYEEAMYWDSGRRVAYNFTSLRDGIYYYNVTAYTYVTSNSSETRNITLDNTAPVINLIAPQAQAYSVSNLSLNFSVIDYTNITCWYSILNTTSGGVILTNTSIPNCLNTTLNMSSGVGLYKLFLYANDTFGYLNSSVINLSYTQTAVFLDYPANNRWLTSKTNIDFNFTVTDDNSLDTCKFYFDGAVNTTFSSLVSAVRNKVSLNVNEGLHNWSVWCNDSTGLTGWALNNWTVGIDTVAPTIAIPSITTIKGFQTITFYSTQNDTTSGLSSCKYTIFNASGSIDGLNNNVSFNCNNPKTATTSAFGNFDLKVYSTDIAGLESSTSKSFTVELLSYSSGGGGGSEKVVTVFSNKTSCGDGICQSPANGFPNGNDAGLIEDFYTCQVDCPGYNLDTTIRNCFDKDPTTTCIWDQAAAKYFGLFMGIVIALLMFTTVPEKGTKKQISVYTYAVNKFKRK